MFKASVIALASVFALTAPQAFAATGDPPVGNAIYQLTGQAISGTYQQATVNFTANAANTNLTFAFRDDPAYIFLSNVLLVDISASSGNLLINGDFSGGTFSANGQKEPDGWTYLNIYGATYGGRVDNSCGFTTGTNCYVDGAVGAYDGINQVVSTISGDNYSVSFYYYGNIGEGTYAADDQDMFVYAGDAIPTAAPEPAALALLASGILGMAFFRRRQSH